MYKANLISFHNLEKITKMEKPQYRNNLNKSCRLHVDGLCHLNNTRVCVYQFFFCFCFYGMINN